MCLYHIFQWTANKSFQSINQSILCCSGVSDKWEFYDGTRNEVFFHKNGQDLGNTEYGKQMKVMKVEEMLVLF